MDQIEKVRSISRTRSLDKEECFVRAGRHPHSFAYVHRGLFRYFYSDRSGKEFTKGFFPERSFIASYSALFQERESYFSVQALESSVILEIDYEPWKLLADRDQFWQLFLIRLLEKGYSTKEMREREFLLLDATERYQSFLRTYPGLEKRVRQHMIASYLGITPVALSRLRKNALPGCKPG